MIEEFSTTPLDLSGKKIWVAGHRGMVGSALCRALTRQTCTVLAVSKEELDCRRQADVENWMAFQKPDIVIIAAARVGGIRDNATYPADFLYDNLMIEANIIHAAHQQAVEKLLFLGSSCIYPKHADHPITEDALLSGALEPTNQWYALAKIAGIRLCQAYRTQQGCNFISAMPCNLYGPGDTYDPLRSHVIPAMIGKLFEAKHQNAKNVTFWGTGTPLREFLHVDDLADGLIHLLKYYNGYEHINIGSETEISILDLAYLVADLIGYEGKITFDPAYTDGTLRKKMDNRKIHESGWYPRISLKAGLQNTIEDFIRKQNATEARHAA